MTILFPKKQLQLWLITLGYLMLSFLIVYLFDGTGGEADSIHHYLIAKYAPLHPELYLNHWAKPLFTLLLSPFSQFGFIGAKLFNILAGLITVVYLFKITVKLELKNPVLAPLFFYLFPLSFITIFSGFTEPLCAAMLSMSIYYCLKSACIPAAIVLSFLPFVRSEGLLFIGIFGAFFIYNKSFKAFILLGLGHVVYSLIGYFYYHDLLWVFTKIPYAYLNSHYGSGELIHFADQLIYITGVPLLILFLIGLIRIFLPKNVEAKEQTFAFRILIVGGFLVFFIAHTLFWYLGIFNSMGLKRVFGAITPLMAILCLLGFNSLEVIRFEWLKKTLKAITLAYILVFPFTSNPAALNWNKDMNLSEAQQAANEVARFIKSTDSIKSQRFIYTDPYLSEAIGIDPFDSKKHLILSPKALSQLKSGDVIIWDNWHAVVDYGTKLEDINQLKTKFSLNQLMDTGTAGSRYVVYKVGNR